MNGFEIIKVADYHDFTLIQNAFFEPRWRCEQLFFDEKSKNYIGIIYYSEKPEQYEIDLELEQWGLKNENS